MSELHPSKSSRKNTITEPWNFRISSSPWRQGSDPLPYTAATERNQRRRRRIQRARLISWSEIGDRATRTEQREKREQSEITQTYTHQKETLREPPPRRGGPSPPSIRNPPPTFLTPPPSNSPRAAPRRGSSKPSDALDPRRTSPEGGGKQLRGDEEREPEKPFSRGRRKRLPHGLSDDTRHSFSITRSVESLPPPPGQRLGWSSLVRVGHDREGWTFSYITEINILLPLSRNLIIILTSFFLFHVQISCSYFLFLFLVSCQREGHR